jgi:hypothetical protein
VLINDTSEYFEINSFSNDNRIFKKLNSSWKIYKPEQGIEHFQKIQPFLNKNPFLGKHKRKEIKNHFEDDLTLIDYSISFEFQKPAYNIFSRGVTDIISTVTLTSFVNQTRKQQLQLLRKINKNYSESSPEELINIYEIENWIKLNLFSNEKIEFWKLFEENRIFRDRLILLFELFNETPNLEFLHYQLRKLFDDFRIRN